MEEMDEFEAMEAEAEELARKASEAKRPNFNLPQGPGQQKPIRPIVRPGQPNPNVVSSKQQPQQVQKKQAVQQVEEPIWVAFYQPEVIGIYNTQTGEKIEGYKDEGSAQANAKILNDLNTIIISMGA